jgi:hypothetical protein
MSSLPKESKKPYAPPLGARYRAIHPRSSRLLAAVALATILGGTAGCKQNVNLSAVTAFSEATSASAPAFAQLSGDFYSSCVRQFNWRWARSAVHYSSESGASSCATSETASQQWQAANVTLVEYVQALGNVAGGSGATPDYGLSSLTASINPLTKSKLTNDEVTAIAAAGTALTTALFDVRRRSVIADDALKANKSLDELISTLKVVARNNYAFQLDGEQLELDRFFSSVVPLATAAPQTSTAKTPPKLAKAIDPRWIVVNRALGNINSVQVLTLKQDYLGYRAGIDAKRTSIAAYIAALDAIEKAHTKLTQSIASHSTADVSSIVQAYSDEFAPQIKTIESAFATKGPQ